MRGLATRGELSRTPGAQRHINQGRGIPTHSSILGLPWHSDVKKSACNAGELVRSLGWEDPLEECMATHSSNLACSFLWTEESGGLPSMVLQRVRHD